MIYILPTIKYNIYLNIIILKLRLLGFILPKSLIFVFFIKSKIPARPYWGSEYSVTCTTIPTTAEAVFYLFLFDFLSRKRVIVFLYTYLVSIIVFIQLILYVFFYFLFISSHRIYIVSSTPKVPVSIIIF